MPRPVHIVIREALRGFRRSIARPVEVALRQDLEARDAVLEAREAAHSQERARLAERIAALESSAARVTALESLRAEVVQLQTTLSSVDGIAGRFARIEAACVAVAESLLPAQPGRASERRSTGAAPRVSIILPTRDRADLVGDAIRSVLAQAFHDWELLIVDDGSADRTAEVLQPFLSDPRIVVLRSPSVGPSAARNVGLQRARGEITAYIDSDNLWFPGFLAGAVAAFEQDQDLDTAYGILVADAPYFNGSRILWRPFDRATLLRGSFIDLGTFVHRRRLFTELGGFDEALSRIVDWDLVLRYTEHKPARPLAVLSTYYRTRASGRVTERADYGSNWYHVRRKWLPRAAPGDRPRVLCVVGEEPRPSLSYVLTELRALERLGADLQVWSPSSDLASEMPDSRSRVRSGPITDAMNEVQPDLVHALGLSGGQAAIAAGLAAKVPLTLRTLGHEPMASLRSLVDGASLRRAFVLPQQLAGLGGGERVRSVPAVFDTQRFRPAREKDRRLVVQNAAGLSDGEIRWFLSLASATREHVLVLFATRAAANVRPEIARLAEEMASPARLALDLSNEEMSGLVGRAGIYVRSPGRPDGELCDAPTTSDALQAMATGACLLAPDSPWSHDLVDGTGALYGSLEEAAARIRATEGWSDAEWRQARTRSIDCAFVQHADETTLWSILQDWCEIASAPARPRSSTAADGAHHRPG
jgi:hypothetical protein